MAGSPETLSQALVAAPSAASSVAPSVTGIAWGNTSWVQVIASTPSAIVLAGIIVETGISASEFEVDVGSGGAGSEVVIGTIKGGMRSTASSNLPEFIPFPISINNIATSTRVAVRFRTKSGTAGMNIAIAYYATGTLTGITTTANPSLVAPSAANQVAVTNSSTAWANSAWTQIIASTASAIYLAALSIYPAIVAEAEIDIGTGGAGSEVVITTFRALINSGRGHPGVYPLANILDNIPISTRIAVRMRANTTTTGSNTFGIIYYNKPI